MFDITPLQGGLANVKGFYCGGTSSGMKPDGQNDIGFICADEPFDISAVFTTNKFQAAPIQHFKRYAKNFQSNFLLLNSKNANAMTGQKGIENIDTLFESLEKKGALKLQNPIMSSTGVIGVPLDVDKMCAAFDKLNFTSKDSDATAKAIMTTDSFKKELCFEVELEDGKSFKIAAICKGAGMINPAMATMLCFILTDADIPKNHMDELLSESLEQSFNAISVDGDTSTNDTVMILSSKKANCYDKSAFKAALDRMTHHLALEILRDGEGSNKVVAFEVKGAATLQDAQKASKALSNSLLVKTALFGEDPNWGRIASTIGASGVTCKAEELVIAYDNVLVYSKDNTTMDEEIENRASKVMQKPSFKVICNLNVGDFSFTSYGCDLSYEYVKINADYRT